MTESDRMVGITADGLVVIRSGSQAKYLGLDDPFAGWFVTEDGIKLVQMARQVDAVYEEFNLARYIYTGSLLSRFANQYEQMIFLGAGFDCRPLWLDGLNDGHVTIYEVDTPEKLGQKKEHIQRHGVAVPEWNRHVACDLLKDDLRGLLKNAGLASEKPVLLLAEGIFFYLPADITRQILDPGWFDLAKGSLVIFDCWSAERIQVLNHRIRKKIGKELFQTFPFMVEPEKLQNSVVELGYERVLVSSLAMMAEKYYHRTIADEFASSWWIVEAWV